MREIFAIILLGVFLVTAGCTSFNKTSGKEIKSEAEVNQKKTEKNSPVNTSIGREHDFTYLEQLPNDKVEKYNQFLKDGDVTHLTDFTPEQIVLIYMNLVLRQDVDKIYLLTYDNGQLPSLATFENKYDQYLSQHLTDNYLKYRFYDSISVDEKTRKKEDVAVQIKIIYGSITEVMIYGLKKEKNVWEMDLYHLVGK
ncbi:hypothetical protein DFP93_10192 [Aneurinibacillus soli]|uniref:Uncharacterized protein n=1 Tax=Aneurinibacillus soli TaxID=1500254 RepID=A0A0U5AW88_9BACL|nr:hypothetical protein [Aneurinibacillus soli]PYE64068.1 hypothetical protein DFP93_10192 [Aneurinibacillus soli]BAU28017.1 hypothetical protein CB4_02191 [Aneurinibacillus soli]